MLVYLPDSVKYVEVVRFVFFVFSEMMILFDYLASTIVRDRRYLTIAWAPSVGPALLVVSAEESRVSDLLKRMWSEVTAGRGTYRSNEVPSLPVSFAKLIRRGPPLIMLP